MSEPVKSIAYRLANGGVQTWALRDMSADDFKHGLMVALQLPNTDDLYECLVIPSEPDAATIERMAQALHAAFFPGQWDSTSEQARANYRRDARVAYRALVG